MLHSVIGRCRRKWQEAAGPHWHLATGIWHLASGIWPLASGTGIGHLATWGSPLHRLPGRVWACPHVSAPPYSRGQHPTPSLAGRGVRSLGGAGRSGDCCAVAGLQALYQKCLEISYSVHCTTRGPRGRFLLNHPSSAGRLLSLFTQGEWWDITLPNKLSVWPY